MDEAFHFILVSYDRELNLLQITLKNLNFRRINKKVVVEKHLKTRITIGF